VSPRGARGRWDERRRGPGLLHVLALASATDEEIVAALARLSDERQYIADVLETSGLGDAWRVSVSSGIWAILGAEGITKVSVGPVERRTTASPLALSIRETSAARAEPA
jgi:hypothetical protein